MDIKEYNLKITYDNDTVKELIYRGNENIIIKSEIVNIYDGTSSVLVRRHVMEKFLEMIKI